MPFFILFCTACALISSPAYAQLPGEEVIIRCMIGEAADQGELGLQAVGEAIRNRGHLKGVYGCKSGLYDTEPQYVRDMARRAWRASERSNLTLNSDHWENIRAFGVPYWAVGKVPAVVISGHAFYNDIK